MTHPLHLAMTKRAHAAYADWYKGWTDLAANLSLTHFQALTRSLTANTSQHRTTLLQLHRT